MTIERFPEKQYYILTPHTSYSYEGIPVVINSRGMRDRERDLTKPLDGVRILLMGDSIVFGWELPLEHTLGSQLQVVMEKNDPNQTVEVIPVGAPG